jgi:hypothetical protein
MSALLADFGRDAARLAAAWCHQRTSAGVAQRRHPSIEECHRLTCQHSARDIDGGKRRLIGDLGTSNHDLSDLARKLIDGRRKDEAGNAAPDNRPHTHAAWLARGVERGALQFLRAMRS